MEVKFYTVLTHWGPPTPLYPYPTSSSPHLHLSRPAPTNGQDMITFDPLLQVAINSFNNH